jgi:uncharacterized protein YegP (UPF0339 family)
MANELIVKRLSDGIETEISRDALTGGWDVHVDRPTEGDDAGSLIITLEPKDTPNKVQLSKVEEFRGEDNQFYFAGVAVNGEIVFPSEGYSNAGDRNSAAEALAEAFGVEVVDRATVKVDDSPNPDVTDEEIEANEFKRLEEEDKAAALEQFGGGIERRRRAGEALPEVASTSSPALAQEVIDTAEALAADAAAAQELRDEAEKIRAGEQLEGQVTVEEALTEESIAADEQALEDKTVEELHEIASVLEIEGRSGMNKAELIKAITKAEG